MKSDKLPLPDADDSDALATRLREEGGESEDGNFDDRLGWENLTTSIFSWNRLISTISNI